MALAAAGTQKAPPAIKGPLGLIARNSELTMAMAVVVILLVMVVPLPPMLLDLLLSFSITFALTILLVGMYIMKPLELSSFPSILLVATLFRLSLNVASTRLILLHGQDGTQAAGRVIEAFGSFVVGGNYLVGLIVFIILVVINFMVITKGAGRIAEVAARFTLDAMPGKQMSIDADLNAGLISESEAKERRKQISQEAEYYGAMDGANKFVRGDAVAGIIITLVNIVAGLAIGVLQNGMSFADAAQNYTLLTVGDGLVSQIPALIISTSAGIIVSRAGAEDSMGNEISGQLMQQPRAIGIAAGVLFGFGLIPGLPTLPFFTLAALTGGLAFVLFRAQRQELARLAAEELRPMADEEPPADEIHLLPPLDLLALEIGYGLIHLVDADQNGELLGRIKTMRQQVAKEVGIIVPPIHIQDNMRFKPGEYVIMLKGNVVARGELVLNSLLAINPAPSAPPLDGELTKEPTFGLPAYWIKESAKDEALAQGYTVVDTATVLTTHLTEVVKRHAHEYLGRQEVQQMLDNLKSSHPKVVEELVPNLISLGGVGKVLQNLLQEQVPVRDLLTIMETLADWASFTKDVDVLTEYVRQGLARTITGLYRAEDGTLPVITLEQSVEEMISGALQQTDQGSFLALAPDKAQRVMQALAAQLEKVSAMGLQPVVLCAGSIRVHFKKLADRFIPNLVVLSYNEILNQVKVQSIGTVGMGDAD